MAGRVRVRFDADTRGLERGTKKAQSAISSVGKKTLAAGAGFLSLGVAINEVKKSVGVVTTLAKGTAALSRQTGMDTREASRWVAVARARGIEAQKLSVGFTTLSKQIKAANDGTKSSAKAFKELGVSQKTLASGNTSKIIAEVSDGLSRMGPGAERTALASKLFGKSYAGLLPMLADGSAKLKENLALSDKYGLTLNGKTSAAALNAAKNQREMNMAMDGLRVSLGNAVIPTLATASGKVAEFVAGLRSGKGAGGDVANVFQSIKRAVGDFIKSMGLSKRDLQQFGQAMTNVFNAVKPVISSAIKGWQSIFRGFARSIGGLVKLISGILTGDFGKAWQGVKQIFSGGVKAAGGIIRAATAPIRHAAKAVFGGIASAASSAWRAAKLAIGGFINDIIGIVNKIPGVNIGKINMGNSDSPRSHTKSERGYAQGGYLTGHGLHDTVPILAAPGEAILNRHQQGPVEHALRTTYGFGLDGLFSRVTKPHYMAQGGKVQKFALGGLVGSLPSASSLGFAGSMGNVMMGLTKWVVGEAAGWMREKIAAIFASRRSAGSANGLVPQVKRALSFARSHGWSGSVVSGFRSAAQQEALYRAYLNGTGNLAAPPGNSSHEKGEAVDVSSTEPFAAAMASAPANARLYRRVPGEPWHFSVTGHARGGFVRAARGGRIGRTSFRFPTAKKGKKPTPTQRRAKRQKKATHKRVAAFQRSIEIEDAMADAGLDPFTPEEAAARLATVDKLLAMKGLSREDRIALLQVRSSLVGDSGSSDVGSTSSSDDGAAALAAAVAENTKALQDHTKEIQRVSASNQFQIARAITDMISQQLGGRVGGAVAMQAHRPVTA